MANRSEVGHTRRWADGDGGDALDGRIGALFRNVAHPPALDDGELALVGTRLRRGRSRRTSRVVVRYFALAAVGMLAGTGFAGASFGVRVWLETPPSAPSAAPSLTGPNGLAKPGSFAAPQEALPEPTSSTEPGARAVERAPSPEAAGRGVSQPLEGTLERESELLQSALVKLRRERSPAAALAVLDRYDADFPHGVLRLEASVARLDAWLELGRRAEALSLLERLPIDRLGRGPELLVVRAELRAERAQPSALLDFDAALSSPLSSALEERALFGRAGCRLRQGDRPGALSDIGTYLARYPNGRFASKARAHLGAPHR